MQILIILISYLLGTILFGEIVTQVLTHHSASELGTSGNPGMANVMAHLGIVPGVSVLLGDVGKCLLAALLSAHFLGDQGLLLGGLAATIGHDFPFWRHFKGGKGVATTCILIFMYAPLYGLFSLIMGLITVIITQYLSLGGIVIPLLMIPYAFYQNVSDGIVMIIFTLLMIYKFMPQLKLIPSHQAEKTDLIGAIKRKRRK